jgi:hypothetical protein
MKKLLLLVVVATVGVVAWRWQSNAKETPSDARLVTDRLWIDHLPRNDRDVFQAFAALSEEPMGVFQETSVWKGSYEVFRYEGHGDELRIVFPQNGDRETVRAKARTCNEGGMDYCLELSGTKRGAKRYYSRKGWEIGSLADEQAQADALAHQTPAE